MADEELKYPKGTATLNQGLSVMMCLSAFEVPQTFTDPISEPSTIILLSLGLAGLGFVKRRRFLAYSPFSSATGWLRV
ncbi:MAG: PEP-CTERM sorting domain-containing protein [Deltaproteobacteria bacterium]|nr:PEP-CTERM sorting domain-containing protein [Deltaproteobacteria bacterium]